MFVTIFSLIAMLVRLFASNLSLTWIALFQLGLAPGLANAADTIPPDKAVITLTPKFGPVVFSHQRHSDIEGTRCITCHHTIDTEGEPIRSCYSCHEARYYSIARIKEHEPEAAEEGRPSVRNAQEAFHGLCTGCHKQRHEQKLTTGPHDSCRDCHN